MRNLIGPPGTLREVVAILGEDLAAAALKHCLEANGATMVTIRNETVLDFVQKLEKL